MHEHAAQIQLADLAALRAWLAARGVAVAQWGTGSSKPVEALWAEVVAGESVLHNAPLRRTVTVLTLLIEQEGRWLVEQAQQFEDGRQRLRRRPPSEKQRADESLSATALRCLHEELGVGAGRATLLAAPTLHRITRGDGHSYPGLLTEYRIFRVPVRVAGLPSTPFQSEERGATPADCMTHFWTWEPWEVVAL